MNTTRGNGLFHVGDRVRVDLGRDKLTGEVVEERGAIGARGRRLYQVRIPMDPFDPMIMELAEDEMEAAPPAPRTLDTRKIVEYLANGGLVSILRSNMAGGKNQPRVWLCPDQLGNVTHTFFAERGVVGGQIVPVGAVRDGKVFTPKRTAVASFVESFGLSRQEAEYVAAQAGTSP